MLELAYFALLAAVYARADLSFAYPIARGSAPVLVLLISVIALGAPVGARGRRRRARRDRRRAARARRSGATSADAASLALALASARASPATRSSTTTASATRRALPYFELVLIASAIPYAAAVLATAAAPALRAAADRRSAAAGVGMVAAYVLVLEALERAEAAPVAALRETSVVMAAVGAALARPRARPGAAHRRRRARRGGRGRARARLVGLEALDEAPAAALVGEPDGPDLRGAGDEAARGRARREPVDDLGQRARPETKTPSKSTTLIRWATWVRPARRSAKARRPSAPSRSRTGAE